MVKCAPDQSPKYFLAVLPSGEVRHLGSRVAIQEHICNVIIIGGEDGAIDVLPSFNACPTAAFT